MSDPVLGASRRIHIVGIGGAGMSAIAAVLVAMGHHVSGSDLKEGAALERLRALGVRIGVGHDPAYLEDAELVTVSTAIPATNVELVEATRRKLLVLTRAQTLAEIASQRRTLAVSGTHGKTTTTSMLALIAIEAGLAPSFLIGGDVNEIGTNAVWDDGDWLVVEADESDGTFLELHPEIALVTSVEADHLEHYGSLQALEAAFARFLADAPGAAIVCRDDENAFRLAPIGAITYGFSPHADVQVRDLRGGRADIAFTVAFAGDDLGECIVPVPGEHNARNAAGAIAGALQLGIPFSAVQRALARFTGVARRFEFRGEVNGVTFVDDYAHLPGEVAATLAAARRGGWRRIVAVFQPHRYSRLAALADEFVDAFLDADVLVLAGVYAAGETPRPGVSAKRLLDAVLDAHPDLPAAYFPQRAELVTYLRQALRPGDCCLTMSAGDLTTLPDELIEALS